MFESKYRRYLLHNDVRFAEESEIVRDLTPIQEGAGVPLYAEGNEVFVDNSDNHTVVIGPTGCKKSRLTVMTAVASIIHHGESAVINDPKGEIYRKTAHLVKERGGTVYVLNLRDTKKSNSWNPLSQAFLSHKERNTEAAIQY
ncbi:MAG: type IV secretory system conjugative DNA transfer family protein, partial [Ruminococcus sp.]